MGTSLIKMGYSLQKLDSLSELNKKEMILKEITGSTRQW